MTTVEIKRRKLLLRDFQNGLTAAQTSMHIAEKFGNKGFGIRTCQRWYRKFRDGDLDLQEKPSHRYYLSKKSEILQATKEMSKQTKNKKQKCASQKEVQVDLVTFKVEEKGKEQQNERSSLKFDAVQKLIQKKSEITLSKVNKGVEARKEPLKPNFITKRLISSTTKNGGVATMKGYAGRTVPGLPMEQKRQVASNGPPYNLKKRGPRTVEADLKLPPNIAKRMAAAQSLPESHSIGQGRKTAEGVKKPITVQFQNVSPELAKNTIRKPTESAVTPFIKRLTLPQSTPLSSPKGVIYLNPQEIFGQSLGFSPLQRPMPNGLHPKPLTSLTKTLVPIRQPIVPPHASQAPITVSDSDSDSDDDLVFPEDVSLPAPKIKAVTETFTTYWDMETDKPLLLNPAEEEQEEEQPVSVIEID